MEYASATNIGKRELNEDSFYIPSDGELPLIILADGMGGHNAGQQASQMAVSLILEAMQGADKTGGYKDKLNKAINYANSKIYDCSKNDYTLRGMGTTVTAALLTPDSYNVANIGDSRIYLFNRKELVQVSIDHSLVSELYMRGIITQEQARKHPQRNIITRALGTRMDEKVDIFEGKWAPGDIILACTDGLYGYVTDNEIFNVLTCVQSLDVLCNALIELALSNNADDNITVVMARNTGGANT